MKPVEVRKTDVCVEDCALPDFNDIKSVETYYSKVVDTFLKHPNKDVQAVGLCIKNMAIGLVAFLAEAKRHDIHIGDQANAIIKAFAQIMGNVTLACASNADEASHLTTQFAQNLVIRYARFVSQVTGDDKLDFEQFCARKRAERSEYGSHGALGFLPNNGTKH